MFGSCQLCAEYWLKMLKVKPALGVGQGYLSVPIPNITMAFYTGQKATNEAKKNEQALGSILILSVIIYVFRQTPVKVLTKMIRVYSCLLFVKRPV